MILIYISKVRSIYLEGIFYQQVSFDFSVSLIDVGKRGKERRSLPPHSTGSKTLLCCVKTYRSWEHMTPPRPPLPRACLKKEEKRKEKRKPQIDTENSVGKLKTFLAKMLTTLLWTIKHWHFLFYALESASE